MDKTNILYALMEIIIYIFLNILIYILYTFCFTGIKHNINIFIFYWYKILYHLTKINLEPHSYNIYNFTSSGINETKLLLKEKYFHLHFL